MFFSDQLKKYPAFVVQYKLKFQEIQRVSAIELSNSRTSKLSNKIKKDTK